MYLKIYILAKFIYTVSILLYTDHHHQLRYNPCRVLASARSLLHLFLSCAAVFQLLIPIFLASWATLSTHLSLGIIYR
jgi:hypothetical protein